MAELSPSAIKAALEAFFQTSDGAGILKLLQQHPELEISCNHKFPSLHRILDFELDSKSFRLARCESCEERLTLESISTRSSEPGVPLWLSGEALAYWVRKERKYPSEGPTDWERLRQELATIPIAELESKDDREAKEADRIIRRVMGCDETSRTPFLPIDPPPPE